MKKYLSLKKLPMLVVVCLLFVSATAWQNQVPAGTNDIKDTIPPRKKNIRNIEEALEQIEKAQAEMERSIRNIDFNKLEKELSESLQKIDLDAAKMKAEMEKALKEVDLAKIKSELERSIREVDVEKLKAELQKTLKDVDVQKIQAEAQAAIAKVDVEKIKKELEEVKKVELAKIKSELEAAKPELERSMKEARERMEEAREELTAYKFFIDDLHSSRLINKHASYKIEHRNGALYINGKQQDEKLYNKHRDFLSRHKEFVIEKTRDSFRMEKK